MKDQVILRNFIDVPKTNPNEDLQSILDNEIIVNERLASMLILCRCFKDSLVLVFC